MLNALRTPTTIKTAQRQLPRPLCTSARQTLVPSRRIFSQQTPSVSPARPFQRDSWLSNPTVELQRRNKVFFYRMPEPQPPSAEAAALQAQLDSQADKVRSLKASGAAKEEVDGEVAILKDLKKQVAAMSISGSADGGKKKGSSKKELEPVKFTLKTAKGTRDWDPLSMSLRSHIFRVIESVFKSHGGVTIDTPVFELKEILSGKYGEDSKLIYDLQDQGGELCSLRYDLTVPFARFVAMNPSEYGNIKRYHIAKVYRRDQPAMAKGRFREFYQCDFDISGSYDLMLPDSEILHILSKTLTALGIRNFTIKLNHRAILDGMFAVCGVPEDKIRTISSAVDKLDKSPWDEVKREMLEKGLDAASADQIGEYVLRKGKADLLEELLKDEKLTANATAKRGLEEMKLLFTYLEVLDVMPRISFDLSLARGLDYYTGIIYEAITEGSAPPPKPAAGEIGAPGSAGAPPKSTKTTTTTTTTTTEDDDASAKVGVGSIAAGGRYDNLVGMFSGSAATAGKSASHASGQVPCVGVSVGVERVFSIMMARLQKAREAVEAQQQQQQQQSSSSSSSTSSITPSTAIRAKDTEAYILSIGKSGMLVPRMKVAKVLWDAGIKAEYAYKVKPKLPAQFNTIAKDAIPFAVILAPEEWGSEEEDQTQAQAQAQALAGSGSVSNGSNTTNDTVSKDSDSNRYVRVKEQKGKGSEEGDSKGELVRLADLAQYLKGKLQDQATSEEILRRVMEG